MPQSNGKGGFNVSVGSGVGDASMAIVVMICHKFSKGLANSHLILNFPKPNPSVVSHGVLAVLAGGRGSDAPCVNY